MQVKGLYSVYGYFHATIPCLWLSHSVEIICCGLLIANGLFLLGFECKCKFVVGCNLLIDIAV